MAVSPVPAGYPTLIPTAAVKGCAQAIEAYRKVFGAEVKGRFDAPDGSVAHCELRLGSSLLMMGEAGPMSPAHAAHLMLYVADVDATHQRAVAAGFTSQQAPAVQFWGDRTARLTDPFGNQWYVATHVEDVSDEEIHRRMAQLGAA